MRKKNIINAIVLLVCVLITLASVMNVVLDNTEVLAMAQRTACAGKDKCDMAQTSLSRIPFWQSITYTNGKKTVEVRCQRAAIVFGDYECKVLPGS